MKIVKAYTDQDLKDGNSVPFYSVSWDRLKPNKWGHIRTGNGWASKKKAVSIYNEKLKAGLRPEIRERRIAGFV